MGKVGDSLAGILEGDQAKIAQQKNVNDSMFSLSRLEPDFDVCVCGGKSKADRLGLAEPVDQYLQTYSWNKVKYRIDKPIAELIDTLRKVRRYPCPYTEVRA